MGDQATIIVQLVRFLGLRLPNLLMHTNLVGPGLALFYLVKMQVMSSVAAYFYLIIVAFWLAYRGMLAYAYHHRGKLA